VSLEGACEVAASFAGAGAGAGALEGAEAPPLITHAAWCPTLPGLFVLAIADAGEAEEAKG
jgi:hypothetical protein